jgi:hypothetical protein
VGFGLPVSLGQFGALTLSGSAAIPAALEGSQEWKSGTGLIRHRDMSSDTYWAILEASWAHPIRSGLSMLAGFRYDCWQTSLRNPRNTTKGRWPQATDRDSVYLTVNSYLPFVGVMGGLGGLTLGAIGLPMYFGEAKSEGAENQLGLLLLKTEVNFKSGQFVEVFAEYLLSPLQSIRGLDVSVAIFGKFNSVEAKSVGALAAYGSLQSRNPYNFTFRRNLFIFGAEATLNFDLPVVVGFFL